MDIKYICPFWGQENKTAAAFVQMAVDAGYDGVEVNVPEDADFNRELMREVQNKKMRFVAQLWMMPTDDAPKKYMRKLEKELMRRVEMNPSFINSHTGRDYYSFDDNCRILEKCQEITQKTGMPIVHETHRGRFAFSAKTTAKFLKKFPELALNADFSHWVLVSESFLDDQPKALEIAIDHAQYIHARVGHIQTPQVNHPLAPENEEYLLTFVEWWKSILAKARLQDKPEFFICPEFGPAPYMPALPFTNQPVSSQWEINKSMMNYLRKTLV